MNCVWFKAQILTENNYLDRKRFDSMRDFNFRTVDNFFGEK